MELETSRRHDAPAPLTATLLSCFFLPSLPLKNKMKKNASFFEAFFSIREPKTARRADGDPRLQSGKNPPGLNKPRIAATDSAKPSQLSLPSFSLNNATPIKAPIAITPTFMPVYTSEGLPLKA